MRKGGSISCRRVGTSYIPCLRCCKNPIQRPRDNRRLGRLEKVCLAESLLQRRSWRFVYALASAMYADGCGRRLYDCMGIDTALWSILLNADFSLKPNHAMHRAFKRHVRVVRYWNDAPALSPLASPWVRMVRRLTLVTARSDISASRHTSTVHLGPSVSVAVDLDHTEVHRQHRQTIYS